MKAHIKIPKGWRRLRAGSHRYELGDMALSSYQGAWYAVPDLMRGVRINSAFPLVIRRIKRTKKGRK